MLAWFWRSPMKDILAFLSLTRILEASFFQITSYYIISRFLKWHFWKTSISLDVSIFTRPSILFHSFQMTKPLTTQKMKFSIKDFFSKCDQIRNFLRIWSHFLKKSVMGNFIFCAVAVVFYPVNIPSYYSILV